MLKELLPMNLQFFAEDTGADGDGGKETTTEQNDNADTNEDNHDGEQSGKTFTRKELRGMIADAIDSFKKDSLPDLLDKARKDGEERAKMTASQREDADRKAREAELSAREAELNHRDAISKTRDLLTQTGLSADFAEMLVSDDDDKRSQNVEQFNKAFTAAVQAGVEERLKGKTVPGQQINNGNDHDDTDFARKLAKATHPSDRKTGFFGAKN